MDNKSILEFASEAAKAFGIGESKTISFDGEFAKKDVKESGKKKENKKARKNKADSEEGAESDE